MKVWVAERILRGEGADIVGVFSSEELAKVGCVEDANNWQRDIPTGWKANEHGFLLSKETAYHSWYAIKEREIDKVIS